MDEGLATVAMGFSGACEAIDVPNPLGGCGDDGWSHKSGKRSS